MAANEKQLFIFTATTELSRLGVKVAGDDTVVDFDHTATAAANLKAALETLVGGTWTVTGTLTATGTTPNQTFSGSLIATAGGTLLDSDVPQVLIVGGEVAHWVVTGGDSDADYAFASAAARALGQTAAQRQTDIRAVGGDYANVIVSGSEAAPTAGDPTVAVFDAQSSYVAEDNPDTSYTWQHTCTGTDRLLIVAISSGNGGTDTFSGVTYNGVSMTLLTSNAVSASVVSRVYYLVNPASGANDIVVSLSAATNFPIGKAVSYTNADQATQPDVAVVHEEDSGATVSTGITTASANDLLVSVLFVDSGDAPWSPTDGATARTSVAETGNGAGIYVSDNAQASAGAGTVTWSKASSTNEYSSVIFAIRGVAGVASAGSADYLVSFPASVGNVTEATVAGTGATVTTTVQGSVISSTISSGTETQGGNLTRDAANLLTETGSGSIIDRGATVPAGGTLTGWTAQLNVPIAQDPTANIVVVISHSDNADMSDPDTLATFDSFSAVGSARITSTTNTAALKRYVQVAYTIADGADPGFVIAPVVVPARVVN
jgi:hypothetical protein